MDEISVECGVRKAEFAFANVLKTRKAVGENGSAFHTPHSAFGLLLALAGLLWVLHDFQYAQLRALATRLDARWIALAVVFDVLSYVCQGLRWRLLLKPLTQVTTLRATQAVYAGLFTNEILPLRLGEVVRSYLVSRWAGVEFAAVLPSLLVERLFDACWLVAGIGLTALFVPLPAQLLHAAAGLGVAVVALAAALFYLVLRRSRHPQPHAPGAVQRLLARLAQGVRGLGNTREFYGALFVSFWLVACQTLAFWLVMRGCGLAHSFWVGAAVYLIVHLGTAVPNAPANVGAFQFFTVIGLTLFGVDKSAATAFSLVVFLVLTLPLWLLGCAAISASGMGWNHLRRAVQALSQS